MSSYKVFAPFVNLKVKDFNGQTVVQGYYMDGVVHDPIEDAALAKHVRNGWVGKVDAAESDASTEATSDATGSVTAPVVERPAGNASLEAWTNYALESDQASEDDVKGLSRDELRELYG